MYKGFSRVIYSILNGSVILERNETRLARNETRGGKLPLSGTVHINLKLKYKKHFFPHNTKRKGSQSANRIHRLAVEKKERCLEYIYGKRLFVLRPITIHSV